MMMMIISSSLLWIWDGPYTDFILLLWILVLSVSTRRFLFVQIHVFVFGYCELVLDLRVSRMQVTVYCWFVLSFVF